MSKVAHKPSNPVIRLNEALLTKDWATVEYLIRHRKVAEPDGVSLASELKVRNVSCADAREMLDHVAAIRRHEPEKQRSRIDFIVDVLRHSFDVVPKSVPVQFQAHKPLDYPTKPLEGVLRDYIQFQRKQERDAIKLAVLPPPLTEEALVQIAPVHPHPPLPRIVPEEFLLLKAPEKADAQTLRRCMQVLQNIGTYKGPGPELQEIICEVRGIQDRNAYIAQHASRMQDPTHRNLATACFFEVIDFLAEAQKESAKRPRYQCFEDQIAAERVAADVPRSVSHHKGSGAASAGGGVGL